MPNSRARSSVHRALVLAASCLLLGVFAPAVSMADVRLPIARVKPGRVISWGGPISVQDVLRPPAGLDDAVAVAASDTSGSYSNLALRADGTVVGWGLDTFG